MYSRRAAPARLSRSVTSRVASSLAIAARIAVASALLGAAAVSGASENELMTAAGTPAEGPLQAFLGDR